MSLTTLPDLTNNSWRLECEKLLLAWCQMAESSMLIDGSPGEVEAQFISRQHDGEVVLDWGLEPYWGGLVSIIINA